MSDSEYYRLSVKTLRETGICLAVAASEMSGQTIGNFLTLLVSKDKEIRKEAFEAIEKARG